MLKVATALTICYLFADLLSRLLKCYFKFLWKINGNYIFICIVSNKISFLSYSIFNLLLPNFSSGCPLALTACISYHKLFYFVKHFFKLFSNFFKFFKSFLFFSAFALIYCALALTAWLYYHFLFILSNIFHHFFKLFLKIFYNSTNPLK